MIDTWGDVARSIALVWGFAMVLPALIYVGGRSISRTKAAMDRDTGIVRTETVVNRIRYVDPEEG